MYGMWWVSITPTECNSGWGWVLCRFAVHMEEHVQGCSCRKLHVHVRLHNSVYTHIHSHMKSLCTICSTMLSYQNTILVVRLVDVMIKYFIWNSTVGGGKDSSLPSILFFSSSLHLPSLLSPSLPSPSYPTLDQQLHNVDTHPHSPTFLGAI